MVGTKLAIIIPALNEESTIQAVISSVSLYGQIIVIDDGSIDNTAHQAALSGAIVFSHKKNLGYDKALNTGFKIAKEEGYKFVITMDADGQHDPNIISKIKMLLIDGYDLVLTSRNYKQRLSEYIFSYYTNLRWAIKDPLSGLKGYRISLYSSLGHFDSYGSIGTELMIYGLRNSFKVTQIETFLKPRKGLSRFGKNLKTNYQILRAIFLSIFYF